MQRGVSVPQRNIIVLTLAALAVPFVVLSTYLFISRQLGEFEATVDQGVFVAAIFLGLFAVAMLPLRMWVRVLLTIIWLPISVGLSIYYAFWFVCIVFGDCL